MIAILSSMASSGSFSVRNASFLLSSDEVDVLEDRQWIVSHGDEFYSLSPRAADFLVPVVTYKNPVRLGLYSSCAEQAKMTTLELVQRLASDGWVEEPCKNSRAKKAFAKGAQKVWYSPMDRAPFRNYLQVLVEAKQVLKSTTSAIHHGQLDS